jgi:NAD(P)-dependent dehydrogenase (short-subunit alcohol dehydrogenase family)
VGNFLVTGAAKRIGRQIALDLAQAGHAVAVHYDRSRAEAEKVCRHIEESGGKAVAISADLAKLDAPERLIAASATALGPLDGLINNAAIFEPDEIESMSDDSWSRHITVNLRAPVFLAQIFARQLPEGRPGNIINILDQRVLKPTPKFFSYTIAKSALWTATRTLAQSLAPGIRVNAICPGPTLASQRMDDAEFAKQSALAPLGRGASPEEISASVAFILAQPAMTGQLIVLDGGQHLAWKTADVVEVRE